MEYLVYFSSTLLLYRICELYSNSCETFCIKAIFITHVFNCLAGIFLEKLLRGGKIEIFVSKGGHACVRVHALIVCVPVLIINVCVPA